MRLKGSRLRLKRPKEVLNVAKKELDEAGDRGFGDALENSHPGLPDGLWSKLWLDHEYELGKARKEREFAEREVGLLKDPSQAAELDISKDIPRHAQIEAAPAMRRLENSKKAENRFLLRER